MNDVDVNSRRDRWVCIACIAVLWTLIGLPTVFYAIPYEEKATHVNITADNDTLRLLHQAGIQALTDDIVHLLQLVYSQFPNVSTQRVSPSQYLHQVLQQPCGQSQLRNTMGFCVPNCVEWTIYDSSIHKLEDTLLGVGFTVGIISGLIVLVTWIFVRQMWEFPHVIPFYMNISASLSVFILCLTYVVGRPGSFCASRDLSIALESTTAACNIQGSLVHYFSHAAILWWMFSVVNLYAGICCPLSTFTGRLFSDKARVHIIESTISWTVPLIDVVVVHGIDQYYPTLGPDTIGCTPRSRSLQYFTQALPIQIFLGTGLTLIIRVVFTLKDHVLRERERHDSITVSIHSAYARRVSIKKQKSLTRVGKRFVFIFITYPICMVAVLITVVVQLRDVEDFENSFRNYLFCVALQVFPDSCRSFLRSTHHELSHWALVAFICYSAFALAYSLAAKPIQTFWYERFSVFSCYRGDYVVEGAISRSCSPQPVETNRNHVINSNGLTEELKVGFNNY